MGGTTTFLTVCYILVVNPKVLLIAGIPIQDGVVGTALSASVGCFVAGLFGNLPFGLSPGLGLTAYVVYGMVLGNGATLSQAFTACFISGCLLIVISSMGISKYLLTLIPRSVRLATVIGMGLQIALAGLESVHAITANERTIMGLGDVNDYHLWLTLIGLVVMGSLMQRQYSAAILITMLALTILSWIIDKSYPEAIFSVPERKMKTTDFISFEHLTISGLISPIVTFLVVGLVDVGGCILGLGAVAGLIQEGPPTPTAPTPSAKSDENNNNNEAAAAGDRPAAAATTSSPKKLSTKDDVNMKTGGLARDMEEYKVDGGDGGGCSGGLELHRNPNYNHNRNHEEGEDSSLVDEAALATNNSISLPGAVFAFIGCGVATLVGACFGGTPTIVVVESAVGIKVGARTGLAGCVVGFWFALSLFLTPFLAHIPNVATAPVAVLLGVMMMSQALLIDWNCMQDAIPAFLTATMIPFTFSVADGIIIGITAAAILSILNGDVFTYARQLYAKWILKERSYEFISYRNLLRRVGGGRRQQKQMPSSDEQGRPSDDDLGGGIGMGMGGVGDLELGASYAFFENRPHPPESQQLAEMQFQSAFRSLDLDLSGSRSDKRTNTPVPGLGDCFMHVSRSNDNLRVLDNNNINSSTHSTSNGNNANNGASTKVN